MAEICFERGEPILTLGQYSIRSIDDGGCSTRAVQIKMDVALMWWKGILQAQNITAKVIEETLQKFFRWLDRLGGRSLFLRGWKGCGYGCGCRMVDGVNIYGVVPEECVKCGVRTVNARFQRDLKQGNRTDSDDIAWLQLRASF